MFLATDTVEVRDRKVRQLLHSEPSLSLIVAAVNFEWTVCRAIMFLSPLPNTTLRAKMAEYYSLPGYKDLWREEVAKTRHTRTLPSLISNWSKVCAALVARNRLVHGRDRYTRNMASPHIDALLEGVNQIDIFCKDNECPLYARMPVRRRRAAG